MALLREQAALAPSLTVIVRSAIIAVMNDSTQELLHHVGDLLPQAPAALHSRKFPAQEVILPLSPFSGRARLSYRRAEEVFKAASGGWTLHQLRHSAITISPRTTSPYRC